MTAVPFENLLKSFLIAAAGSNMEVAVVAMPRNVVGQSRCMVASNTPEAVGKARAQLLVQDGAIERASMALHAFRFVEEGKTVEPGMDFCSFLPCAGADAGGHGAGGVLWDEVPELVKEAHRTLVKVLLGVLMADAPKEEKKLVSV